MENINNKMITIESERPSVHYTDLEIWVVSETIYIILYFFSFVETTACILLRDLGKVEQKHQQCH